jgi:hypothetical protein
MIIYSYRSRGIVNVLLESENSNAKLVNGVKSAAVLNVLLQLHLPEIFNSGISHLKCLPGPLLYILNLLIRIYCKVGTMEVFSGLGHSALT